MPLGLYGIGMGLMLMPLNTHLINAAPRKLVSRVTALTNALQQVISSLTIAGLTTFLTSRPGYSAAQAAIAKAPQPNGAVAAGPAKLPDPIAALFSTAFDDTFKLMAVIAVVGAAMGLLLRRKLATADAPEEESAPAGAEQPRAMVFG